MYKNLLPLARGTYRSYKLSLKTAGTPTSLAGAEVEFLLVDNDGSSSEDAIIRKLFYSDVSDEYSVLIEIEPEDTAELDAKDYWYRINLTPFDGQKTRISKGILKLEM